MTLMYLSGNKNLFLMGPGHVVFCMSGLVHRNACKVPTTKNLSKQIHRGFSHPFVLESKTREGEREWGGRDRQKEMQRQR